MIVEVTDLAAVLGLRALARRGFIEDRRQHHARVLIELAEAPPNRLVRRYRGSLQPCAARVCGCAVDVSANALTIIAWKIANRLTWLIVAVSARRGFGQLVE
jgi:hypothetical protein